MTDAEREAEIRTFLSAWEGVPQFWLGVWGTPSKLSHWFQVDQVSDELVQCIMKVAAKENAYLNMGWRSRNLGVAMRGETKDVAAIPGVWLDIDYNGIHGKKGLPPTEADAKALVEEMGLPPSCLVHSGGGLQAHWWLNEPWVFTDDADRERAAGLLEAWNLTLRLRAKARGWVVDSVFDLARVMRIPGTFNWKKSTPRPARLLAITNRRYEADHVRERIPQEGLDAVRKSASAQVSVPDLDWHFVLRPDASPPPTKFAVFYQSDDGFRRTWDKERGDMHDQSPSGYDLALANYAMKAGWTAQETINLMIAWRREHGAELHLKNVQKYRRTLNLAASLRIEDARLENIKRVQSGEPLPPEVLEDRAEVFKIVGDSFGFALTKVIKLAGDAPVWILEINGKDVRVRADDFNSQTRFSSALTTYADIILPKYKWPEWQKAMQMLLAIAEIEDLGPEVTGLNYIRGSLRRYLEAHTNAVQSGDHWHELARQDRPFAKDGLPHFSLRGLQKYLKDDGEKLNRLELSHYLARLGCTRCTVNVRGKGGTMTTRSVFLAPSSLWEE